MMRNANKLREKIASGKPCFCATITFSDPTVCEALCDVVDFLWIDMEHNPLSLEAIQGHIMATKGSDTATLVRVRSNDPSLIKTVLDIGADGIIAPNVHNAEEARQVVAACSIRPWAFAVTAPAGRAITSARAARIFAGAPMIP